MKDKGGRRLLADRRQYSYSEHFPERRATRFRRSGVDRRSVNGTPMENIKEKRAARRGSGRETKKT